MTHTIVYHNKQRHDLMSYRLEITVPVGLAKNTNYLPMAYDNYAQTERKKTPPPTAWEHESSGGRVPWC